MIRNGTPAPSGGIATSYVARPASDIGDGERRWAVLNNTIRLLLIACAMYLVLFLAGLFGSKLVEW